MGLFDKPIPKVKAASVEEQKKQAYEQFMASPAGRAREAYEQGDLVFQCRLDVVNQTAIHKFNQGSGVKAYTPDPNPVLNAICQEGWELVNGSFAFVQTGHEHIPEAKTEGTNTAVSGNVAGYYLFKRCAANHSAN